MSATIELDHVALATRAVGPVFDVLVGELGGTVLFGGNSRGFRFVQVRVGGAANGMTVELLEPWDVSANDFLQRFLARRGEGPHHLTFKVDDLAATLERVGSAGYRPVGVDLSDPQWKEAFLHPSEAHGTVVQLAQARRQPDFAALFDQVRAHGPEGHPLWWPEPPPSRPAAATLSRVVVGTPSVNGTLALYAGVLGGAETARGEGWFEVGWPGGGRVRIEQHRDAAAGIDRLAIEGAGTDGDVVVAGTRLRLAC